jgi:hypothetical protein
MFQRIDEETVDVRYSSQLLALLWLGLFFYPEGGGSMLL